MPVSWPLVGRREELEFIEDALGRPDQGGVVLAGEAGVGKTRLAREATSLADSKGISTAWAAATQSGRTVPFGALAPLLPPALPLSFTQEDVIRSAARAISERFDGRPLIAIDDAHLLDDHSAVLLHHLAQTSDAFVLAAIRSGEPAPDPITALWKDDLCERLEIQALSESDARDLLEAALDGQVDGGTFQRLWAETRGNPLYLREMVLGGLSSGRVVKSHGVWRWDGNLAQSPRLHEMIATRLGDRSAEEKALLETLAAGEPLGVATLENISSRATLGSLEEAGLVIEDLDGRRAVARLAHPLYGEALRAGTSPARLRTTLGALAEDLEASGVRRREDTLRLATWSLESGRETRDEILVAAGGQALGLLDFPLAERLAGGCSDQGMPAGFILAQALMGQGRSEEAESAFARMADSTTSETELLMVTTARAYNLGWTFGELDKAVGVLDEARPLLKDPVMENELLAARAYFLFSFGKPMEAIAAGREIIEFPDPTPRAVASVMGAVGQGLQFTARPLESMELWNRFEAPALEGIKSTPMAPVGPTVIPYWGHYLAGRFEEAAAVAERSYLEALESQAEWVSGFLGCLVGIARRTQGRLGEALRYLREGTARVRRTDVLGQLPAFLGELAQAMAADGDVAGAEEALAQSKERRGMVAQRFIDFHVLLGEVTIAVAKGEVSRARQVAAETAEEMRRGDGYAHEALLLHEVARLGDPAAGLERLAWISERSDGALFSALYRNARAMAWSDAAELEQVSRDFEEMGALLYAAEAAAEASNAYRSAGRTASAHAAAERTRALMARCENVERVSPVLAAFATPLPLTSREREVASFAARGLSNREIASRLFLSPRTVGNHLHSAYSKLGIEGREQLRAILEPAESPTSSEGTTAPDV